METSDTTLQRLTVGPFYNSVKTDCKSKTVKWTLVDYFPEETKVLGMLY